ncbi:MAG: Crp/Fnr family transcriptional regulator [Imperialibacter sp.]|uniref:Crp/Fnr family transcriptional regulator n=1 Tax=Imperialibacter sp. TaxID=2038411 RepID=UPI0032EFD60F
MRKYMLPKDVLYKVISRIAPVPEEELDKLFGLCHSVELKKASLFVAAGDIPTKFGIVVSGLFRYYYLQEGGNEFTKGFFSEGSFLSSYSATIAGTPSHFSIEALENSEVLVFDYSKWEALRTGHPGWNQFLITVLEEAFTKKETREREFLLFDAKERYRLFLKRYPGLEKRVRQHVIASYLGITNVALSRVRRKMGILT